MRPIRLSLILLPVLFGATLAACSVRTERTVYTPAPPTVAAAPTVVVPASGYYYYREPYHTGYYSSY